MNMREIENRLAAVEKKLKDLTGEDSEFLSDEDAAELEKSTKA